MKLKEALKSYSAPVYVRVRRGPETYSATETYVTTNLERLVDLYRSSLSDQQTLRLIRDDMDNLLRRYHGYCIKENIGSHYVQVGLDETGIFEHMVPNSTVRDLLIDGIISPKQACNMPTCRVSVDNDVLLREKGWASKTPDIYNFWTRYSFCFEVDGKFTTYDGTEIDADKWTLDTHFEYFCK